MATLDLISSGLTSVRQGQNRMSNAASDIARVGTAVDPTAPQAVPAQPATGQAASSAPVESARPVNLVDSLTGLVADAPILGVSGLTGRGLWL